MPRNSRKTRIVVNLFSGLCHLCKSCLCILLLLLMWQFFLPSIDLSGPGFVASWNEHFCSPHLTAELIVLTGRYGVPYTVVALAVFQDSTTQQVRHYRLQLFTFRHSIDSRWSVVQRCRSSFFAGQYCRVKWYTGATCLLKKKKTARRHTTSRAKRQQLPRTFQRSFNLLCIESAKKPQFLGWDPCTKQQCSISKVQEWSKKNK